MSTLPEQFSEARKFQLNAQFDLIRRFTGRAFDSAEKIMALNFDTSRASLDRSSALVRQMLAVKDPRDLFALAQGQSQLDSVMAYGRQLFSIVATPITLSPSAAPALAAPVPGGTPAAPVQASLMPEAEAEVAPAPIAEPKAIAKAAGKEAALPKPTVASFPVASSAKPIAVKLVEAAPVSGTPEIVTKKAAKPAAKAAKKK